MNISSVDILNKVKEILAKELKVTFSNINENTNLASDLGADSLDTVELAAQIEEQFECKLNEQDISKIKTVADIVDIITDKLGKV